MATSSHPTAPLTASEVADRWGVSEHTVRSWVRDGKLEAVRLGPGECVHIDDLENNVLGAEAAGFRGIHHKGDFAELTAQLRALGVDC